MRCRVVVRGKVQGVGFRWFVRQRARSLGLAGWVSNCQDGSVQVQAEGDHSAIDSLLESLRTGPPGAQVVGLETLVQVDQQAILPNPFTIERG